MVVGAHEAGSAEVVEGGELVVVVDDSEEAVAEVNDVVGADTVGEETTAFDSVFEEARGTAVKSTDQQQAQKRFTTEFT